MDHDRASQNLAVESYLLGEMTPGEREDFEQHYFDCPACAQDVREAMTFMADTRDVLDSTVVRVNAAEVERRPVRKAPRWFAWLQPQAALVAIGALTAVCLVESVTIPALRQRLAEEAAPKVVGSSFLRPQTRGAAKVVQASPGEPLILMFDAPESTYGRLRYVLKSADGRNIFELTSAAPSPGEPVTLSIPKLNLQTGTYDLVVETPAVAGQTDQELGSYPFELQRP